VGETGVPILSSNGQRW